MTFLGWSKKGETMLINIKMIGGAKQIKESGLLFTQTKLQFRFSFNSEWARGNIYATFNNL